ncbi:MAG: hypothetical protein R3F11_27060 [Verrucomicrobiales bacterium]
MAALRREILRHLEDDILSFGWLAQLAAEMLPDFTPLESADLLFDLLQQMVDERVVVIGSAELMEEIVMIEPWEETGAPLGARMRAETEDATPDREFCFWIQLRRHFLS